MLIDYSGSVIFDLVRAFTVMSDFTVVVLEGAFASSVSVTVDVLATAAAVAPGLRLSAPTWEVVSTGKHKVGLSNGMSIATQGRWRNDEQDRSTWIVPGLGVDNPRALATRLAKRDAARVAAAMAEHVRRGGRVAASCSAVFLLQAAGVLAGRTATTSWWLASELQRLEPTCAVQAQRMVCSDGPVASAGAAFAHVDLLLHLLATRFSPALAQRVQRVLLLDARAAQAPYAMPSVMASGDALVARLMSRMEASLPQPLSVRALAKEFAMSERTLARRVHAAVGMTPLALLQGVRLNRARMLIESTRLNIEQVAEQVGYEDSTALRRLMRKLAGATPSRFRTQVGSAAGSAGTGGL